MVNGEVEINQKDSHTIVRVKLSKVQFPERCPVCNDEAEDLVPISIFETSVDRWTQRRGLVSGWEKEQTAVDSAIAATKGGTTFWVPACLAHGTDTVATPRKKIISIVAFMLLFYPFLYYALGLIAAIEYSRPVTESLIPLILLLVAIIMAIIYGFYPRALERSIRFIDVNRGEDEVLIALKNPDYRKKFLELNEMFAESLERESTKTDSP